jgi:hypothetical protein
MDADLIRWVKYITHIRESSNTWDSIVRSLTLLSKKACRIGSENRRYVHDDTKFENVKALGRDHMKCMIIRLVLLLTNDAKKLHISASVISRHSAVDIHYRPGVLQWMSQRGRISISGCYSQM